MVAWPSGGKALWFSEHVLEGSQESIEHCRLVAAEGMEAPSGLHIVSGGADAAPEDPALTTPECHA